ncbi:MAG: ABC transporter ATP-binding protein [Oscillospiraceae bacterium]|nr:ABC transporter ATP-binding protein [Oscillospiraceae bacterium]
MEKILEVKNLKISFRTSGGSVKAVRDISFDLEKGKTLAIVGESGSGKSVTSKAILGILAGNAIVEGGEILYDGKDLLKISEEDMCNIRGDAISMIFQDPLSSLNPIVKIGRQITEAMLLKNKTSRKEAKAAFNKTMELLRANMAAATGDAAKLNELTLQYLDENFMNAVTKGMEHSFREALAKKQALLPELQKAKEFYSGDFTKAAALKYAKQLSAQVENTIDRLEMTKDSAIYTFRSQLFNAIDRYFYYKKRNPKEEARFSHQTKKREALIARGKNADWKVVPKVVFDLDEIKGNMIKAIEQLERSCTRYIEGADAVDFRQRSVAVIDYLKDKASKAVYKITRSMAKEKAIKLMEEVGIAEPRMRFYQYPFEFSGGMRQRIVIAIALAADPEVLICDEPTTALDVTIQAQILELINRLKAERNLSVVFITHDLGVVANMADDIAVMYAGKIVEYGTADDIFYDPRHPYTWALLSSMPDLDTKEKLDAIPGTPPNMIYPPVGDAFADRNKYAMQIDFEQQPPMFPISETHKAATWLLHPDAPAVEAPKIITDRIARMKQKQGGA